MPSEAQRRAIRRYESSGKRPGHKITVRLTDEQLAALKAKQCEGESLAGCIKRHAGLTEE